MTGTFTVMVMMPRFRAMMSKMHISILLDKRTQVDRPLVPMTYRSRADTALSLAHDGGPAKDFSLSYVVEHTLEQSHSSFGVLP